MTEARRSRVTSVDPGPVYANEALVRLWGDDQAGWVHDVVYVSSERLYQIVLSMPPGAAFRHSERNRTVFGADELYLVLDGTFALANPETGEVLRLGAGEAAWFGPDTWHHGVVVGDAPARVLEFFAPPPAAGMSQDYARTRPYLERSRTTIDEDLERWPSGAADRARTIRRIDPARIAWRLEGERQQLLVGIVLSTSRLTVGIAELLPGAQTDLRRHGGDLGLYVHEGNPTVILGEPSAPDTSDAASAESEADERASQLAPDDGFYVPAGTAYRLANEGTEPVRCTFGVAPRYAPGEGGDARPAPRTGPDPDPARTGDGTYHAAR